MVKNLPAMQETHVQSLGQEDSPGEGMAIHSSISWKVPWAEEPGGLQSTGSQRVGHDWVTNTHTAEPVTPVAQGEGPSVPTVLRNTWFGSVYGLESWWSKKKVKKREKRALSHRSLEGWLGQKLPSSSWVVLSELVFLWTYSCCICFNYAAVTMIRPS